MSGDLFRLIFTACQSVKGYLMPIGKRIAFVNIHILGVVVSSSFWYTVIWYQVFLSNSNDLHTVVWFPVFLSHTDNLLLFILFSRYYFWLTVVICLHSYMVSI